MRKRRRQSTSVANLRNAMAIWVGVLIIENQWWEEVREEINGEKSVGRFGSLKKSGFHLKGNSVRLGIGRRWVRPFWREKKKKKTFADLIYD